MQHEAVCAIEATLEQDLFCQAGAAGFEKSCIRCVSFCTRSISRIFNSSSIRFHRRIAGNSGTMQKWPCFTRNKIENIPGFTKGYDALCLNTLIYLDSSMDALGVLMVRVPWIKYMITISPMEDSTTRIHPCTNFFLSIQCLFIDTFRAIHPGQWLFENAMRPKAVHNHDFCWFCTALRPSSAQ